MEDGANTFQIKKSKTKKICEKKIGVFRKKAETNFSQKVEILNPTKDVLKLAQINYFFPSFPEQKTNLN